MAKKSKYLVPIFMMKNNIYPIIQIFAFAIFVTIILGMVFSRGVCCGDDAFHAVVAKNLAFGSGYTSTLQPLQNEYDFKLFDPLLGTGPSIIVPAAIVIKLVGNTYWAPGITIVLLWAIPLLFIGIYVNKKFANHAGVTLAVITFFFFSTIFMAYHFEQWYALLGEIPVAMLVILAILIYLDRNSKKNLFLVGLLFSLASLAKIIAILPFLTFLLFVIAHQYVQNKGKIKKTILAIIHSIFFISLGFMLPLALFESWKLLSLGINGYLTNWSLYFDYLFLGGVGSDRMSIVEASKRVDLIQSRFGIYLPFIFLLFVGIGLLLRKEKRLFAVFITLVTITVLYTIYWIFFSIGWARYYIIAMIFIIFILSLPFIISNIHRPVTFFYALTLIAISFFTTKKIDITFPFDNIVLYKPSQTMQSINAIDQLLVSNSDEKPFVTQWWATAVDIEYLLDTQLNFTTYKDPDISFHHPFIFVANSKFLNNSDQRYLDYSHLCQINTLGPYIYGECGQATEP